MIFCFKQKTAYEMRISDWSSDVCSSDLNAVEVEAPSRQADMLRPVPCEHARAVDRLEPHVADRFRLDLIRPEDSEPGCLRFRRQEPRSALERAALVAAIIHTQDALPGHPRADRAAMHDAPAISLDR